MLVVGSGPPHAGTGAATLLQDIFRKRFCVILDIEIANFIIYRIKQSYKRLRLPISITPVGRYIGMAWDGLFIVDEAFGDA